MKPWHFLSLALALALATCTIPAQPQLSQFEVAATSVAPAVVVTGPAAAPQVTTTPAPVAFQDSLLIATNKGNGTNQNSISPVDPRTGQALPDYAPLDLGYGNWQALSPDGQTLALVIYAQESDSHGILHLVNLARWADEATSISVDNWVTAMVFSPDSTRLALAYADGAASRVKLVDLGEQPARQSAEVYLDFAMRRMAFTPEGDLAVYGRHSETSSGLNPDTRVALLAGESLGVRWTKQLSGVRDGEYGDATSANLHDTAVWWTPVVLFAPDGSKLYVLHADLDLLTTVDLAARSVATVAVARPQSLLERLLGALGPQVAYAKMMNGTYRQGVLSADGTRLYTIGRQMTTTGDSTSGNLDYKETSLGLQVIDVATGTEVAHYATEAQDLMWSPGQKYLLLHGWRSTYASTDVIDPDSLELLKEFKYEYLMPTQYVNGAPALVAQRGNYPIMLFTVLDPQTFAEIGDWTVRDFIDLVPRPWPTDY